MLFRQNRNLPSREGRKGPQRQRKQYEQEQLCVLGTAGRWAVAELPGPLMGVWGNKLADRRTRGIDQGQGENEN